MKKYIIYIAILVVGLLLGWMIFGGTSNNKTAHNHDTVAETNQMWTCSMHPQIMQPEPGDCPICGMDLIPAEAGADGLQADQFRLTENAMALANIQTSMVGSKNTEEHTIKLSGKIVANEEANAVQISYFSGRIERLEVNFTGEEVQKGQLLASIYSPELYAAQQELITASALKETQPALYKAVRNKLKLWKLSENQINQIEISGKIKENFPVYATVSGTVSEKLVEQGDFVKQGQPLLKIANLNSVWALFDVYENQIDLFKKGQDMTITTRANINKEFEAKVDFINPILDAQTRTVKLRAVLSNANQVFKPGMFVEGQIKRSASTKDAVLTIPSTAVLWTGERSLVYLKSDPNQPVFEMRKITLGQQIGDHYQVLAGLNDGDEIVTNGTFTVDAAAQLQGKNSMMNKDDKNEELKVKNENGEDKNKRVSVSEAFQNQLKTVFNDYIHVKDALVEDDSKTVQSKSKELIEKISKVDMKLLKDNDVHKHWMALETEIKAAAIAISKTTEIKEQRLHFENLSIPLTNAIKVFGINEIVYQQYCPMVDNNKGAYWLSKEEKVFNPYFGDAMLTCGEVTQVIE
ncbi:efflux RND transporter periplasmic adaptor subunit [Oceanihabitans sp. IOP_32]|uniref:efflux RND transporter periplasmic adaptor subunit n=1 Tax=Oceanihabitans sp. IOP_32 TaxID=2529032 RepID=UPI001293264B|nr:efflux RND transporter periplasmic adaptor subunit [Oceanihabitans sp. IOP_32]QFZ55867.1 efflux RND transporter periplasmic adaptor subunit [Oceanihabitans sp. IOP_32]